MNDTEIIVAADRGAAADAAAERIASALVDAVAVRGRADWATTGGSTPIGIYRRLVSATMAHTIPWHAVHVWWGDDRFVPHDHPLSNVKPLDDILLGIADGEEGTAGRPAGVPLPYANVHRFPTGEAIAHGRGAAWCAATLADELRGAGLETSDSRGGAAGDEPWPIFDLILLGVGADGHILSVFPGSSALDSDELAMAIPAPAHIEPHVERVTLNPALVSVARQVLVVAHGSDKATVLAEALLAPETDPRRWPVQFARRDGATWILDPAAAARLQR